MLKPPRTPLPRHLVEFETSLWGRKPQSVGGGIKRRRERKSEQKLKELKVPAPTRAKDESVGVIQISPMNKRSSSLPCIATPEDVMKDLSGHPIQGRERLDSLSLPEGPGAISQITPVDLQLGVKCSFMMKQWRLRERQLHAKALKIISSPTMASVKKHQIKVRRLEKIVKSVHGQGVSGSVVTKQKVKHENKLIVDRLRRVQITSTEITKTNLPPKKDRCYQEIKFRGKFLKNARSAHAKKVEKDNIRFLKRLNKTKATFNRKDWDADYKRHKKIRRNMCRLENPKLFRSKKRAEATKRRLADPIEVE